METYLCKPVKRKSLKQLPEDCLQFLEGSKFYLALFNFAKTFFRGYLNKVTLDWFICFAKICEFIFACIVSELSQSGEKTEKITFQHALCIFQEEA